ncbi:MAG TPA: DUF1684 domain-containing protein [Polyangia bacterium]|jgi:hypothetical protein|nr:DUF1684 domain-containing protein [Polyangia bacterium]
MDSTQHEKAVQSWRQAREARLRSSDGWLTLVDRILLDQGENPLPFGALTLDADGVVEVRVQPGQAVTSDDRPITTIQALRPQEGARSALLAHAGRTYEVYRRGDVFAVRVKDPESPALRAFTGLSCYPIDPAWRIEARFERYQPPRTTVHQLDVGPSGPRQVPGIAHFAVGERALVLEPVLEEQPPRLFFVFTDQTTHHGTSPAGRFLYADVPGSDDTVILDFNLAFNPPCAFTAFSTCPIPPASNRMPVAVTAGEKDYSIE